MTKIIVIDDDLHMRRMIVRILTDVGHEVMGAENGRDGLNLFHSHRPNLVITDILMPERDGLETIGEMRRTATGVAIIAISGGDPIYLDIAKKWGADVTLAKPFRTRDLVETVSKLLTS